MKRAPIALASAVLSAALLAAPPSRADVSRAVCIDAYERAQYLRKEDKLKDAREALVKCAQDGCPAATRADCTPWLAEVERALPTIVVAVNDGDGKDVVGAKIFVDGAPYAGVEGAAIPVDPGAHAVRVEVDGASAEESVVARVGEKLRRVVVVVRSPKAKPPPAVVAPDARPTQASEGSRSLALPITFTALGAVGLGAAIGVGVAAKSESNDLRATCSPRCSDDQIGAVETKLLVSDIALGVGIASLAVATYFWLRPASAPASGAGSSTPARISLGAHAVQISF
ncbi:MAG: hypothetical protein JST00_19155 [Deltaproteobacteria bacterium]|nr:hypothetical protein [Deltaproteobacteria bacterium]